LKPLNLYGKSKLDVDLWARDEGYLSGAVGLRYFNVFGPNEFHKDFMRSVIAKKFDDVASGKGIELFRSYRADYGDGEQVRDFIYVKDAVAMTLFLLDTPEANGVFNIGSGGAKSWNEVADALFAACGKQKDIRYIDMPETLKEQYQYFTEADMTKLKHVGWNSNTTPLDTAIADYVQNYLAPHKHLGENLSRLQS
jgi:ADP-L-glycero-D-manno-heptose 6-epimerase